MNFEYYLSYSKQLQNIKELETQFTNHNEHYIILPTFLGALDKLGLSL